MVPEQSSHGEVVGAAATAAHEPRVPEASTVGLRSLDQEERGLLGVRPVDEAVASVAAVEADVEEDEAVPGDDDRGVVANWPSLPGQCTWR